jgi:hypothetical protein
VPQVIAFFERLEKSTSKGQTLLQLSSKYATIVHEDPPPMKSASDFAGFFKMFLPVSWLVSVQGVPLSEVLAPRRALLPRRLPGLASMKKVLPNGSILEEKVEIAVQVGLFRFRSGVVLPVPNGLSPPLFVFRRWFVLATSLTAASLKGPSAKATAWSWNPRHRVAKRLAALAPPTADNNPSQPPQALSRLCK